MIFPDVRRRIEQGDTEIPVEVNGRNIKNVLEVSERQRKFILAGGALNFVRHELRAQGDNRGF